jgi:hypothetical protein
MDLQNPTAKMSKSVDSPQGTVPLLDPPEAVVKKIKSAVSDSGTDVRYDPANKPGVSNLLEIHAAVTGRAVPDVEREFAESGYGAFKAAVADAVVEALRPLQEAYTKLEADPAEVDRQLALGADKARAIADPVLARARSAAGLLPRSDNCAGRRRRAVALSRVVGGLRASATGIRHAADRPPVALMMRPRPARRPRRALRRPGSGRPRSSRWRYQATCRRKPAVCAHRSTRAGPAAAPMTVATLRPNTPRPASSLPVSCRSAAASHRG